MTPEAAVKQSIKELLHSRGLIAAGSKRGNWPDYPTGWYYMPVQAGLGVHGIPDFVGMLRGYFFVVEAKAPGQINRTSANQKNRLAEIAEVKGFHCVADDEKIVAAMLDDIETLPWYADRPQ